MRRWVRLGCPIGAATLAVVALAGTGAAATTTTTTTTTATTPDYEMPFPCGQTWTGTTRADHRPSPLSVDFNRPYDMGDITVSAAPGVVSRTADLGSVSYGRYVVVDHGDGTSTLYAHLKRIWVTTGQRVDQGTVIGLVGDTGGAVGAHLHFEERVDGKVQRSSFHQAPYTMGTALASANCPDVPIAGDWDADTVDQVGVFRRTARAGVFRLSVPGAAPTVIRFGRGDDTPVTGDWDGDGRTDVGVRRPGKRAFYLRNGDGSTTTVVLGSVTDRPVTGDWDGDGRTDVGTWNPAEGAFLLRHGDGLLEGVYLGTAGSEPVTGDWDGDGTTDVGVFDPDTGTFTLRTVGADGAESLATIPFGAATDLPVTGDWDGDGITDVGTWAPATATYSLYAAASGARTTDTVTTQRFGRHR